MQSKSIEIRWSTSEDVSWINDQYEEIGFQLTDFETDQIAIAEYLTNPVGLGRLCQVTPTIYELGGIHVQKAFRGKGIARRIVQFLLQHSTPYSTIYCLPFEHLRNFYEKEGFKTVPPSDYPTVPQAILKKHAWCNNTYLHQVHLMRKDRNEE